MLFTLILTTCQFHRLPRRHWHLGSKKVKEAYMYSAYYEWLISRRSRMACVTRDHTVVPATHTFIKWNEPYLPLLPSHRASPHFAGTDFFWHLTTLQNPKKSLSTINYLGHSQLQLDKVPRHETGFIFFTNEKLFIWLPYEPSKLCNVHRWQPNGWHMH